MLSLLRCCIKLNVHYNSLDFCTIPKNVGAHGQEPASMNHHVSNLLQGFDIILCGSCSVHWLGLKLWLLELDTSGHSFTGLWVWR